MCNRFAPTANYCPVALCGNDPAPLLSLSSKQQTVLVVDDSDIVLAVTQTGLEAAGYRVLTRNRAAGCVGMILQEQPDLVLVDVNMPNMGGEAVVRLFGQTKPDSSTVVLLFSSLPELALKEKARAAGAHGFIRKTNDSTELVRQVNRWLKPLAALSTRYRSSSAERLAVAESPIPSSGAHSIDNNPSASGARKSLAPRTLLFVDDDMLVLSACRRAVQAEGFEIEFALSGEKALSRILSEEAPDVVICDVLMPGLSGVDVFDRAVELDRNWRGRFVFMTGDLSSEPVSSLQARFPGAVLKKPFKDEELRRAILRCVVGSGGGHQAIQERS